MALSAFCTDKNTPCRDICGNTPQASQRQLWLKGLVCLTTSVCGHHSPTGNSDNAILGNAEVKSAEQSKPIFWSVFFVCNRNGNLMCSMNGKHSQYTDTHRHTHVHGPCEQHFEMLNHSKATDGLENLPLSPFSSIRTFDHTGKHSIFLLLFLVSNRPTQLVGQPKRCVWARVMHECVCKYS